MNNFYSQIAIHKKNMWAQWANKFFDALQLVNKNCLNTFHSINIFFSIHTKIFSHYNSKIGSEWMWKYIVHPVRDPNNITSQWKYFKMNNHIPHKDIRQTNNLQLCNIVGGKIIFLCYLQPLYIILVLQRFGFNWFCLIQDRISERIEVDMFFNPLQALINNQHLAYQEGVFVLDVQPVLLFQQCHLLHWQHLNWCTFHLVRCWNPTIQHLEQYPHGLLLAWSVLVLLLMKSLSS